MILLCDFMEIHVFSLLEKALLSHYIQELRESSMKVATPTRHGFIIEEPESTIEDSTLYQII